MAENKTKPTDASVEEFIRAFSNSEQKIKDSFQLIELMSKATGKEPYMWGPSIVGFDSYDYVYESGHSGSAPRLGFSPRKSAISLYVFSGLEKDREILKRLGKFKMGKSCIYVNKLSDINLDALEELMDSCLRFLIKKYDN